MCVNVYFGDLKCLTSGPKMCIPRLCTSCFFSSNKSSTNHFYTKNQWNNQYFGVRSGQFAGSIFLRFYVFSQNFVFCIGFMSKNKKCLHCTIFNHLRACTKYTVKQMVFQRFSYFVFVMIFLTLYKTGNFPAKNVCSVFSAIFYQLCACNKYTVKPMVFQ